MLDKVFALIEKCNEMSKLDAALFYAKIAPVFPLKPKSKLPLLSGSWIQYATQDESVIRQWWTNYPDANIAWVMGNNIMASDLDMKNGEDGWSSYKELSAGKIEAPTQITPSEGYHLIHAFHPGLINFTKRGIKGGIDLRTTNGYILVAPSETSDGGYEWISSGKLLPAPAEVISAYEQWSTESTIDRDVDMPEPTPYDDLPYLEDTTLRAKHLGFLQNGTVHESYEGDRSRALIGATIALYQLGLSDADVLGYLENSPGAIECAQRHSTERRSLLWLWKYTCLKAREKRERPTSLVNEAFKDIIVDIRPDLPSLPNENERERWLRLAENVNPNDDMQAVDIYRAANHISPMFANQVANILHNVGGFRKSDLEKVAKQVSKQQARSINHNPSTPPRLSGAGLSIDHPVRQPAVQTVTNWKELVGRYVYIATENKWIDRYTRETLAPEALNTKEAHTMELLALNDGEDPRRATDALAIRNDTLKVDVRSYWPGIHNDLIHIGKIDAVNTWQPSSLEVVEGDITPWWKLFCHLFPDEGARNRILDWMAHILQKPHIKINYALLVGGRQRIGKDSVFQPLIHGVGLKNVNPGIKAEMLDEKYDDHFIGIKLAVLQEVHRDGFKDAQAIENKMKVYLADPPYELTLRRLGATHVIQRNLIQILAFTNYHDAIHLGSDGDRYLCEWSDAKKLTPAEYKSVYDWYDKEEGLGKVVHYLLKRDLSQFESKASAPATRWREDMITSTRSDLDYQVEDILDKLRQENQIARTRRAEAVAKNLPIVSANMDKYHEVLYVTPRQIMSRVKTAHPVTLKAVTHILDNLGVEKLKNGKDHRFRVPRVFVEDVFAGVGGGDKFKGTIKTHLYVVESGEITLTPDIEAVKLGLCPQHLINEYLTTIN